jgi:hypothetical protein
MQTEQEPQANYPLSVEPDPGEEPEYDALRHLALQAVADALDGHGYPPLLMEDWVRLADTLSHFLFVETAKERNAR